MFTCVYIKFDWLLWANHLVAVTLSFSPAGSCHFSVRWCWRWILLHPLSPPAFITTKHPWVPPLSSSNVPLHITPLSDLQSLLFTPSRRPPASRLHSLTAHGVTFTFLKVMTSSNQQRLFTYFSNFLHTHSQMYLSINLSWLKYFHTCQTGQYYESGQPLFLLTCLDA